MSFFTVSFSRFAPSWPFNPCLSTGAWGPRKQGLGEGLAEKVCKGLAKGWRRVGTRFSKGWRRVRGFPCTLQFRNSRGARLETRVCDSMGTICSGPKHHDSQRHDNILRVFLRNNGSAKMLFSLFFQGLLPKGYAFRENIWSCRLRLLALRARVPDWVLTEEIPCLPLGQPPSRLYLWSPRKRGCLEKKDAQKVVRNRVLRFCQMQEDRAHCTNSLAPESMSTRESK